MLTCKVPLDKLPTCRRKKTRPILPPQLVETNAVAAVVAVLLATLHVLLLDAALLPVALLAVIVMEDAALLLTVPLAPVVMQETPPVPLPHHADQTVLQSVMVVMVLWLVPEEVEDSCRILPAMDVEAAVPLKAVVAAATPALAMDVEDVALLKAVVAAATPALAMDVEAAVPLRAVVVAAMPALAMDVKDVALRLAVLLLHAAVLALWLLTAKNIPPSQAYIRPCISTTVCRFHAVLVHRETPSTSQVTTMLLVS